jgi:hypothetical protein
MGSDKHFVEAEGLPFRLIEIPIGSAPPVESVGSKTFGTRSGPGRLNFFKDPDPDSHPNFSSKSLKIWTRTRIQ